MTVRTAGERKWIFLLNHTPDSQEVRFPGQFKDPLTGETHTGTAPLKPYGVAVVAACMKNRVAVVRFAGKDPPAAIGVI